VPEIVFLEALRETTSVNGRPFMPNAEETLFFPCLVGG
jgi:hypothetical protein